MHQQLSSLAGSSATGQQTGKEPGGTMRRKGTSNGQPGFIEVPTFYATGDISVEGSAPEGSVANNKRHQQWSTDEPAAQGSRHGGVLRNKCLSFLALVAALAALSCSLASLAGTTTWVDTWEPIDLPPIDDWPTLFGTGYGGLVPDRTKDKSYAGKSSAYGKLASTSESGASKSPAGVSDSERAGHHQQQLFHPHQGAGGNATPASSSAPPTPGVVGLTTSFVTARPSAPPPPPPPSRSADSEEDDEDEFDYQYAQDQGYHVDVEDSQSAEEPDAEAEQRDEEQKRSLVVLFHIGLFRACPSLKGELPANVVLPNLPCLPLEYINWRPLSGQSFRLWRNIEFTPDFLNKLRYATPCFLLGTAISFIALAVAVTGRCAMPDRTLIVSSLHILAGLSLGSGLIIFVSVLHDEFSPPTLRSPRYGNSASGWLPAPPPRSGYGVIYADGTNGASSAVAFYPDGRTLATTITASGSSSSANQPAVSVGSGLVSAVLIPSFRYGWSFYAALAAFVSSELAAALYIVLHSHVAKWIQRSRANGDVPSGANMKSSLPSFDMSMAPVPCKEIGVQTSPLSSASLLMMMDKHPVAAAVPLPVAGQVAGQVAGPPIDVAQQIPYCDLLAMESQHGLQTSAREIAMGYPAEASVPGNVMLPPGSLNPMYISPGVANESDCTCQVHYATYRPKVRHPAHVAGINKASTMPRKVAFAGDPANVYQQTPL